MTREEAKKILGENATDEQVSTLLNTLHSELSAKDTQIKDLTDKLTGSQNKVNELSGFADELKKIKEGQMTEQEKMEQAKKELAKQISDNKKLGNSIKAKSILIGAGISNDRAEVLVNQFVKEDEQATINFANELVTEFSTLKDITTKQVKENLLNMDLTPNGSNKKDDSNVMTWDKFKKLSSDEQSKFAKDYPEEFANL